MPSIWNYSMLIENLLMLFAFGSTEPKIPKFSDIQPLVRCERVDNTLDQFKIISSKPISNIYLVHDDMNVQYKFMVWDISNDRKHVLLYDNHTNVVVYDIAVETTDGQRHLLSMRNINLSEIE